VKNKPVIFPMKTSDFYAVGCWSEMRL